MTYEIKKTELLLAELISIKQNRKVIIKEFKHENGMGKVLVFKTYINYPSGDITIEVE